MVSVTTRTGKGSELTWAELDANFTGLADGVNGLTGSTYTGFVASRAGFTSNNRHPSHKQANVRSAHFARGDITSLQVMLANFAVLTPSSNPTGTGAETGSGGDMTFECAIEYPVGAYTRCTFSGSNQGVCANGSTITTDPVTVSIPDGEKFFVRQYLTTPGNILYSIVAGVSDMGAALGEQSEFAGSGLASKVMGGTIPAQGGGGMIYPMAIIGPTTRPSVLGIGDSRFAGQGDVVDTAGLYGHILRAVGNRYACATAATTSDRAQWAVANYTQRIKLVPYASHIVCNFGINDLNGGARTATQVLGDLQTLWAAVAAAKLPSAKLYQATLEPITTSSDSWATLSGQTAAAFEAQRTSLNTSIRAAPQTNLAGFVDIADQVETGRNSGRWMSTGTAGSYTADGIHPSAYGYVQVARSSEIPRKLGLPM